MVRIKKPELTSLQSQKPDWPRRIAAALAAVLVLVLVYGAMYQWVMATFEDQQVPYLQAIQVVIESLTTAGFGGHAPWESTAGNLMVLVMNLSGVVLVFLALPLFVMPLIREMIQVPPPRSTELTGHIIVCGYSEKDEVVRQELEHFAEERHVDIPFLYVEPDPELARELIDRGIHAIVGNPETVETLRAANAGEAKALVADVDDETNPSVVLAAKMISEELPVLSVVRDHRVGIHHEYAGADRVIRARKSFGKSLAIRVSGSYAQKFRDTVQIDNGVEVTELVVEDGCELIGETIAEAELVDQQGRPANVIAAWVGGKFLISPEPGTPIRKNAILVISGKIEDLEIQGVHPIPNAPEHVSRVVIGGFGTVGRTVWASLRDAGIETTVIDTDNEKGQRALQEVGVSEHHQTTENPIDIVGDVTDEAVIRRANLETADAVVLSLNRDIPTIYASILVEHLTPDVEIIARADDAQSISTLYQAGADFVLSLTTVTGEIIASELLDILGETGGFLPASTEFEFTRCPGSNFTGLRLLDIDLRNRTGCTVVAVERDNTLITGVRGDFVVDADDTLIIAASRRAVEQFECDFLPDWLEQFDPPESDDPDEPSATDGDRGEDDDNDDADTDNGAADTDKDDPSPSTDENDTDSDDDGDDKEADDESKKPEKA